MSNIAVQKRFRTLSVLIVALFALLAFAGVLLAGLYA